MGIFVASLTVLATFFGGLLALRARSKNHLVLGLSAGLLLGLVAFDLLPEVFELTTLEIWHVPAVMVAFLTGFLVLHVIERLVGAHDPHEHGAVPDHAHPHQIGGLIAALAMVVHIFLDGLAVALAFKVDQTFGWLVAVAVMAHAFSDGLNTVAMLSGVENWTKRAKTLLGADALARVSGASVGTFVSISDNFLGIYLAVFAGFLTYLATSHILPEAHSVKPSKSILVSTLLGVVAMFLMINLVHG
ncbi:MAG: hypothetical protein RIR66_973 [Actinomycetota bacterium]|jgi:ZIP family zinc transporter